MKIPFWIFALGATAFFIIICCLGLVYVANHNMPNMVRKDYYEAGVHLDEQRGREVSFDSLHLRLALTEEPEALVLKGVGAELDSTVLVRLKSLQVKLFLQRPDDPAADRELVLLPAFLTASGNAPLWHVLAPSLRKGKWECQVVFAENGRPLMERSFSYYAGG